MSVIEETRVPLNVGGEQPLPGAGTERVMIDFEMQEQCHSNWCWAAVAASVAAYYGHSFAQCEVADLELQRDDCCNFECGAPDVDVNLTSVFASPLNRVGCFRRLSRFKQATPAEVREELAAGRPICARTIWPGGGAHFVTIVGCWEDEGGVPMLAVDDPFWGRSEYSYERFAQHYQLLGGKWNDTYYTKRP